MIKKGTMLIAETVLNLVINHHDEAFNKVDGYVEAFENCREQGYRIVVWGKDYKRNTIAFSRNRNSDDIVVYNSKEHESSTFGYSDEFWKSARYFNYNDFQGAADYIVELSLRLTGDSL